MITGLTTHVLNSLAGIPATGVCVELWQVNAQGVPLKQWAETYTNTEGRSTLAESLPIHWFELRFHIGTYFEALEQTPTGFLGIVPVRFQITDPNKHYHIPLVASPWSYTTYKGGMTPNVSQNK